jgi:hypothetical protein
MTPEGKVKSKLRRKLNDLPCRYIFMPVQNGMGAPSLDYLICAGGWFIAIETKASVKHHLTPRQENTKAEIEAAHGLVYVVYDDATIDAAVAVVAKCCALAQAIRT